MPYFIGRYYWLNNNLLHYITVFIILLGGYASVHVLLVIAAEEAELLPAMSGVIGGVHIQDDRFAGGRDGS